MRLLIRVGWAVCVAAFLLGLARPAAADSAACMEENGACEVSNDMGDWVECVCADGEGFGGSGGDDYDGLSEDELLEICYEFLEDCGFVPEPPPSAMCATDEGSCVVGSSPPSYACDCEMGPSAFGDGEDAWEEMTQEELDAVCVELVPVICTGGGSESSTTVDPTSDTEPTTDTDDGTATGDTGDTGDTTDTDPTATATVTVTDTDATDTDATDTDATATATVTDTNGDSSGDDTSDGSGTDASATDATADDDDATASDPTATASATDGDDESSSSGGSGSSNDDGGGCGCRTSEPRSAYALALLLGFVLRRRRG